MVFVDPVSFLVHAGDIDLSATISTVCGVLVQTEGTIKILLPPFPVHIDIQGCNKPACDLAVLLVQDPSPFPHAPSKKETHPTLRFYVAKLSRGHTPRYSFRDFLFSYVQSVEIVDDVAKESIRLVFSCLGICDPLPF